MFLVIRETAKVNHFIKKLPRVSLDGMDTLFFLAPGEHKVRHFEKEMPHASLETMETLFFRLRRDAKLSDFAKEEIKTYPLILGGIAMCFV